VIYNLEEWDDLFSSLHTLKRFVLIIKLLITGDETVEVGGNSVHISHQNGGICFNK
jgi:hypothetical protein